MHGTMTNVVGRTIAVVGLHADVNADSRDDAGHTEEISGLFIPFEYLPYEPSNYVFAPCYLLTRLGQQDDPLAPSYCVDAMDLWEQVAPGEYAEMKARERELEMSMEAAIERGEF